MFELFQQTSTDCSKVITKAYSTSFSMGIKTLDKKLHAPIYSIYGFVRYADEIVDTFHDYDKQFLLDKYKSDTYEAIEIGISLNPILNAYQQVVNQYNIPLELTAAFFKSMEMDLNQTSYGREVYDEYIFGSAEVVGLMCLKVFTHGQATTYQQLEKSARALGAAFQKVNFLRDMKSDYQERGRVYFPGIDFDNFKDCAKKQIEKEIAEDFKIAYAGLIQLPPAARSGVMLAYKYYLRLFKQIRNVGVDELKEARIRVHNFTKLSIWATTLLQQQIGVLKMAI